MKKAKMTSACVHRFFLRSFFSQHGSPERIAAFCCVRYALSLILAAVLVLIAGSSNAHAYIDPGYGSLIWQLLIASFFGGLFYSRAIISKIKSWFKGEKHPDKPSGNAG